MVAMASTEVGSMGYETKVILVAVADIIRTSKTLDEAFARVARIANAEGVVITEQEQLENEKGLSDNNE